MKQYLLAIVLAFCLMGVKAQNMTSLFINMPDSYILQLESAWRKDLVDLYQSQKDAKLQNVMGGYSELKKLTDNYLLLQVSERSTVEIKLFPLVNDTPLICMITTVYGPTPDSRIAFYSPDWKLLPGEDLFTPPSFCCFLEEEADKESESYRDALSLLDMELIHYQLDPDDYILQATLSTPLYLDKEMREKVLPFIKKEPKVYQWKKNHFE